MRHENATLRAHSLTEHGAIIIGAIVPAILRRPIRGIMKPTVRIHARQHIFRPLALPGQQRADVLLRTRRHHDAAADDLHGAGLGDAEIVVGTRQRLPIRGKNGARRSTKRDRVRTAGHLCAIDTPAGEGLRKTFIQPNMAAIGDLYIQQKGILFHQPGKPHQPIRAPVTPAPEGEQRRTPPVPPPACGHPGRSLDGGYTWTTRDWAVVVSRYRRSWDW